MKQYVIDEIRLEDFEKIKSAMDDTYGPSKMGGIYWIYLEKDIFTAVQAEHTECQPFYFAVELEPEKMSCELLVRTESKIRCDCIQYATELQRNWLIQLTDSMLEKVGVSV